MKTGLIGGKDPAPLPSCLVHGPGAGVFVCVLVRLGERLEKWHTRESEEGKGGEGR